MNRVNLAIRFAVAAVALFFCTQCTIGPTAGTETGNPDISACLTTAMALFDSTDRWLPAEYLVEGESQLDPQKVYNAPSAVQLAKRTAQVPSDTPVGTAAEKNGIISRIDTVVVKDTLFVHDTIVIDTVFTDTVHPVNDLESGSSILMTQRIRHDSIFLVDTVIRQNTLFIFKVDSSKTSSNAVDNAPNMKYEVVTDKRSTDDYSVIRDPITGGVSLVVIPTSASETTAKGGASFDVRTTDSYMMVARQSIIGTTFLSEAFRDADGDGLLLSANTGICARSQGNFIYRGTTTETQLQVDFDAGADNRFTTTSDNRISSMFRNVIRNNVVIEQVRYGTFFFGRMGDTILLQCDRSFFSDSIESVADRYTSFPGNDPLDHRKNCCLGILHTITYRSGRLLRTEISVTPKQPVLPGQLPGTGEFRANINYGKGLTGVVSGVIDYRQKMISGIYAHAGVEYHLTFNGSDNSIDLQPFK